jgi:hypothetical protein
MSKDLQIGGWIRISWIAYNLYVVDISEEYLSVSSPAWRTNDRMRFHHSRLLNKSSYKIIGTSKTNPFYNKITKLSGFVHPFILVKH